jgi:hypothetical protein
VSKEYILVAVVDMGSEHPPHHVPDGKRRHATPEDALTQVQRVMIDGVFTIYPVPDAPEGTPALFIIPVARVIQWHVMEASS